MPDLHDGQSGQSDPRPYATALGFYQGDHIEVAPEGYGGHILRTYGSDSHRVTVLLSNGQRIDVEDFDLTRTE